MSTTDAASPASPSADPTPSEGTHKLWGGRFASGPHPLLDAVNRSIGTDFRLWPHDVRLSKAWARALEQAGVLSAQEADAIDAGLDRVGDRLAAGEAPVATDEDIHTMIDRLLHEEAGAPASRLHTGRSRNDQVATATRLWTMHACTTLDGAVRELQQSLHAQAEQLQDAVLPAYTHLQRAQPVSGAHWLLSHFWALDRDRGRFAAASRGASVMPLGSGAIAGSAFPVSRELLRDTLGFDAISANSIDATGDRDFVAETLFACALTAAHCSRIAEDLIVYGSSEFGFVKFGDRFSTGSSMMPQKRNPDVFELARGSGARVLGDLVSMLATIKGLPSGYSKDLQDDKRALFNAIDMLLLVLPAMSGAIAELRFNRERMRAAVTGAMMATDLADYLVRKGASFREAHGAVGRLVRESEEAAVELDQLPVAQVRAAHALFNAIDMLLLVLPAMSGAIAELRFNRERMRGAVTGAMMATDLADYLVRKGASFREAHGAVGRLVRESEEAAVELDQLPVAQVRAAHALFGDDVMDALSVDASLAVRNVDGGTGREAVAKQLEQARARIG